MEEYWNVDPMEGKAAEEGGNDDMNRRDWENLPSELLTQILQHLYLDDAKSFHKVCKTWDSLEDPKDHNPLVFPAMPSQWLVHKDTYTSTALKLFHPVYGQGPHCIDIPELSLAFLVHSNEGWLLFSRGARELFFVNPFTNERVHLPYKPIDGVWMGGFFLSEPTSPACVVFGVEHGFWIHALTIDRNTETWEGFCYSDDDDDEDEEDDLKFESQCAPALHNGRKLYVLGMRGELGVCDLDEQTWIVHRVSGLPPELGWTQENYMVQCDGKLMAVYLSYMGNHVCVLELDEEGDTMEWNKVDSLGDYMLFVSERSSFAAKKVIEGMENKIYFPRFYEQYIVFYCLETRLFKTFGSSNFSQKDLFGTEEKVNCCWMQPCANRPYAPKPVQLDWLNHP